MCPEIETINNTEIKVYPYRWVILALYILMTVVIEIQWLTFASISGVAQQFYQTTALRIDFLAMIYMIVIIVMSIPASYIIDTWGLKKGLINERVTVAGLGSLAQYIGIIIALAVTPLLISESWGGIKQVLLVYGVISVAGSVLLLIFMSEEPPTPPTSGEFTKRTSPLKRISDIFKIKDMQWLLLLFFIGLGIFNAVSTCIDQICSNLTMEQTGMVGE